jgi:predicted DNA-binding transcriptional regulator AlpA
MGTGSETFERLLTERDVASLTGLSAASVRRWRALNVGPKFIRIGWSVRYRLKDVLAWLESRPSGGGTR